MNTLFRNILVLVAVMGVGAAVAGCGDDNAPPDDKSYYTGPMKGKGEAGAGPKTDSDPTGAGSGAKME